MFVFLLILGALIIAGLAFYAGRLLFLLAQQNERQRKNRQTRIDNITESIETIAKAMEQQQCDLSEGAIRICNLLEALPIDPKPDFRTKFPSIFELFVAISGFATLDARKALDKKTRRAQDREREDIESRHESSVLSELPSITDFCTQIRL
jgi:hypothetical protein